VSGADHRGDGYREAREFQHIVTEHVRSTERLEQELDALGVTVDENAGPERQS